MFQLISDKHYLQQSFHLYVRQACLSQLWDRTQNEQIQVAHLGLSQRTRYWSCTNNRQLSLYRNRQQSEVMEPELVTISTLKSSVSLIDECGPTQLEGKEKQSLVGLFQYFYLTLSLLSCRMPPYTPHSREQEGGCWERVPKKILLQCYTPHYPVGTYLFLVFVKAPLIYSIPYQGQRRLLGAGLKIKLSVLPHWAISNMRVNRRSR